MKEYRVRKARPVASELRPPGDPGISQRALLIAALANGPSVISGFLPAEECLHTIQACRALGVAIDFLSDSDSASPWLPDERDGSPGPTRLRVHGVSMNLKAPSGAVDCCSSSTALGLLSGIVTGQPFTTRLRADGKVSRLSLQLLFQLLSSMGASIDAAGDSAPVTITGTQDLVPVHCESPADSLTKGALLLAGLKASGKTAVTQSAGSNDHTERMLRHFQVKTQREGRTVSIFGGQMPESRDVNVPGGIAYAAQWITAAAAQPGSDLVVRGAGLNDTRTGFLRVLLRMGARVLEDIHPNSGGEPHGNVIVRGARLRATVIKQEEIAAVRDELPVLAVAASLAQGKTVIHHPAEDAEFLARIAHNLRLMGVAVSVSTGSIEITGSEGKPLQPGCVSSSGDIRIAMGFSIAGLFAEGETIIEDTGCVDSVYHGFEDELRRFQDRSISEGIYTPVLAPVPAAKR
ncbi:MAG TPA: 3-phosphoshikimate 1-carboxyvinyltransferase [Verrucomicrobiales bacterium]|nr:3-phosphoshikimate 1-carboxyvinyltransferase [Verrucomicrobiales bacterium]